MRMTPALLAAAMIGVAACTHTVRLEPSDKPFKIDLNVNITQELRITLEREVSELIANNPDLF
ncbi:YnbE family lipoprotein [Hyphomonas sp.]|uniref:YnbE family lipoprotein n=1 Tax=Hyphomonas sp. TaxID=87 RepID=UPI00391A297F